MGRIKVKAVVLKPVLKYPSLAHFVCLPHLSHLIQLISSLVETTRLEVGVSDTGRHTGASQ